tara:strand:+ start:5163 stop:6434 length:1272 start_codon:yes stop_codon:yes gene_type:complete
MTSIDNPVIKWLTSCNKYTHNKDEVTHYIMSGGKLNISEDYDKFLEKYSENIHFKTSIVELRTDIFKFFIDFDILSTEKFDINEYIRSIQEFIYNVYNTYYKCIVTKASSEIEKNKNDTKYFKYGFHFNWPDILVNKDIAIKLREALVEHFNKIYGKIDIFYDSWEKIIDISVYTQNGLRMLGADKISRTDGRNIANNRVYEIFLIYEDDKLNEDLTKKYKNNTLLAVKETSIRSNSKKTTPYYNLPEFIKEEEINDYTVNENEQIILNTNDPRDIQIRKFFKNHAGTYRVEDLRKIKHYKNTDTYIIESRSRWCQNINDFHSNNHIYFVLKPGGMVQKCRSESGKENEKGKYCECRNFESPIVPCENSLRNVLKGGYLTKKNALIEKEPIDFKDGTCKPPSFVTNRLRGNFTFKTPPVKTKK